MEQAHEPFATVKPARPQRFSCSIMFTNAAGVRDAPPNRQGVKTKVTRREFAGIVGLGALAAALPAVAKQQQGDVKALEGKLAAPFSPEARTLAEEAIKAVHAASERRWKHKLPENSEPCTIFIPEFRPGRGG